MARRAIRRGGGGDGGGGDGGGGDGGGGDGEGAPPGVFLGPYRLGPELGRGAMGAVYRASDPVLNREVAVKVILSGQFASVGDRQRFMAEAEHAARLDHPGIVPIYQVGETDGRAWFAMKWIDGVSLASFLHRASAADEAEQGPGGPFALREAASLVARIARAVQHAHERGVLHRDLKPANILLGRDGAPHVADFGLARRLDTPSSLTLSGSPVGTPGYMAPELVRGARDATTAADVWSLGAILHELLSGAPPFAGGSVAEVLRRIAEEDAPRLRLGAGRGAGGGSGVRDLEVITAKCLAREPARRYGTAAALADDLERWIRGEAVQARAPGPFERWWRWTRRRPLVAGLSAALVLALAAGGMLLAAGNRRLARALGETRVAEQAARANWHAALLAPIRARRGWSEASFEEDTVRAIAEIARANPSLDTRNEGVIALATRDVKKAGLAGSPEAVFREFETSGASVQGCSIDGSPDGSLVVAGTHAGLDFWDGRTGRHLARHAQDGRPWMSADFAPDGSHVILSGRLFGIHQLPVGRTAAGPEAGLQVGEGIPWGRPFDSTVQATSRGGADWLVALDRNPLYIVKVEFWPGGDPTAARVVAQGEPMTFQSLSPDGAWLASTVLPPADVWLWNARTAEPVRQLGLKGASLAAFSADGRYLVTRDSGEYAAWSTVDWVRVASWPAVATSLTTRIRFSPDGRTVAVPQGTDRVQLLRVSDWREKVTLTTPRPIDVMNMNWSRSGERFLLLTRDGQVREWNLAGLRRQLRDLGLDWED